VESKEALFDFVARYADAPRPFERAPKLPVRTPKRGTTVKYVRERLAQAQVPPTLAKALSGAPVGDVRVELESIVGELYAPRAAHRGGISRLAPPARHSPEPAALWFDRARPGLIELLARYLEDRPRRKVLRPLPDAATPPRLLIETAVFWGVHRHWDSHPQ